MKRLLVFTGATGVLYCTNHPLFVRRKPDSGKEKEVALSSSARRLVKSITCVSLLMASAAAIADNPPFPTQIVDLANKVDGVHPGYRAFHAKGLVVEGSFKASAEAARLSRAVLFNGSTIPVTARFSDGSGMPAIPDGSPAMPRGIAIEYHLPGGTDTDMVTNSFKFFPVGTGEDFRDMLQAIVASPPTAPKPTKLDQFFAKHPNAPKALGTLAVPDSFAHEEYHGIDAFIFDDLIDYAAHSLGAGNRFGEWQCAYRHDHADE